MKQKTRIQSGRGFSGEASWTTAGAVLERRDDGRGGVVVAFVVELLLWRSRGTDLEMEGAGHDGRDDVLRQALWSVLDMMELLFFSASFSEGNCLLCEAMKKRREKEERKKLGRG